MKKDYLWDKTGGDPEIERLENALRVFGYKETALPLPAKVLPFKQKTARRIFPFKFAAAACLAFAAVALGILIRVSGSKTQVGQDWAATVKPANTASIESNNQKTVDSIIGKTDDSIAGKNENTKRLAGRKAVKISREISAVSRRKDTKPQIVKAAKPEIRLTGEERYAYDQLMLALSVTSSKLKLVKNKIESKEEKTVVYKNGR